MDNSNIFNQPTYDLGTDIRTKQDVSQHFLQAHMDTANKEKCCKCGTSSIDYKLIAKDSEMHIPDNEGYVCKNCVTLFNPKLFKLKEISKRKGAWL
ncbi:hypothetical protein D1872_51470 [compost metagenome]